jgi:hypothetical protein
MAGNDEVGVKRGLHGSEHRLRERAMRDTTGMIIPDAPPVKQPGWAIRGIAVDRFSGRFYYRTNACL